MALPFPQRLESVDDLWIATAPWGSSVFEVSPAYRSYVAGTPLPAGVGPAIAGELARLEQLGFLVSPEQPARRRTSRSLVLHLAHACNLACTYCNVKQGTFGEPYQLMSFETARRALDQFTAGDGPTEVSFFGGEPLLNWPVLVRTIEYARSLAGREIHWSVVTNGTLLDQERADTLARLGVTVTLSIDGDRDNHDRNRRTASGAGSYDAAVRGVEALVAAGARGSLHATHDGSGSSYQVRYDHLMALGKGKLSVVIAPETGSGQYPKAFGRQGTSWGSRLRASWREGGRELPGYISSWVDLVAHGEMAERQDCPAGATNVNVTPSGDIFACHVSAARKQFRLGNLSGIEPLRPNPLGGVPLPKACEGCWANGICSHGCPIRRASGLEPSEDECETYREPVRCAAYYLAIAGLEEIAALWTLNDATRQIITRAWMIRETLRAYHQHIRPLAVFPTPSA
jgi:uncharacterized protein